MPPKAKPSLDRELALLRAAFDIAAERGWRDLSLRDAAARAKMTAGEAYAVAQTRDDLLRLLLRRMVQAAAEGSDAPDPDTPARDRIFDVTMLGLEWLTPFRPGLKSALEALRSDPAALLSLRPALDHAARALLDLAGAGRGGVLGLIATAGFLGILARTLAAYVDDEPGLPRTMAALDRGLRRGEQAMSRWPFARTGRGDSGRDSD